MSNVNKTVDVIIPNFNKGNFISEAIDSVINQTYKNWKLYIIDDNSTDKKKKYFNDIKKKNKYFLFK